LERTSSEILRERFNELREAIAAWSKETVALSNPHGRRRPYGSTELNLAIVSTIFSKWSIEIITVLHTLRSLGFTDLRKSIRGISPRVLSRKLRILEEIGIIERNVLNTRPPRVQYALTEKGLTVATLSEPVVLYLRFKEGLYLLSEPMQTGRVTPTT